MNKKKTPGSILRQARVKAKLSQEELANKLGYSSSQFISNWERDRCGIPLKKVVLFCKCTGARQEAIQKAIVDFNGSKLLKKISGVMKKAPNGSRIQPM